MNGISIKLDAGGGPDAMSLKNLTFDSSLAKGSAAGTFDTRGNNRVSGNADIDLAAVFAQIPRITSYNVCYTKLLRTGDQCRSSMGGGN